MIRARSHKYPHCDDGFVDTTYYNEEDEYFDLGYQLQKKINTNLYPEFSYLKKLFIDHNKLTVLPDASLLPNLEYLNCSHNLLTKIPYYPKLTFINIANNNIKSCEKYYGSNIIHFDCGFNKDLKLNFVLPECQHLYANNMGLESINLDLFPKLNFLDCGENQLKEIIGGDELLEINIQNNKLTHLPKWTKLLRLMADRNKIEILETYPELRSVMISFNKLKVIHDQPKLKKIIANDNCVSVLGEMPKLNVIDLSYNQLTSFTTPIHAQYVSVQFNPLNNITINPKNFKYIRELQINFETYSQIYKDYCDKFKFINIQTNGEILKNMLMELASHRFFDEKIIEYIFAKLSRIQFQERNITFYHIACKIYLKYCRTQNDNLVSMSEFKHLYNTIAKFYYKTIVATLYFDNYFD